MLFGVTVRLPFFDFKTFAWDEDYYNIVSIIAEDNVYNELKSEIERYSKDIQWVLENTKVIIFPTPKDTNAFNIASLNESLYFDWYKWVDENVDFNSKLIWTVLIWDIKLPVAYDNNIYSKTILPYTDFEDKVYIFNHETNRYENNSDNKNWISSEIWHWVITPNFWNYDDNIQWLRDYFDKNHDYYAWTWNFKYSEWILNWSKTVWVPSIYKPYVFYYDQFREEKSLNYSSYQWYEAYRENREDIIYSRYSKDLTEKIIDKSMSYSNDTISELIKKIDPNNELNNYVNSWDFDWVPDIQLRHFIDKLTKRFIEIFASGIIWEMRKDVNNAWRYNESWKLNVDMIPYFVTVLDQVSDEITKWINTDLETQIDEIVKNGLSRDIAIWDKYIKKLEIPDMGWDSWGIWNIWSWNKYSETCVVVYENYLFWKKWWDITEAWECSIYRWNNLNYWTLVEANRWTNILLSKSDYDYLSNSCPWWFIWQESTYGYWWWNSPLNISINNSLNNDIDLLSLNNNNFNWAIFPIFDIWGSKEINDSNKIPSPLFCARNNFLLVEENKFVQDSWFSWNINLWNWDDDDDSQPSYSCELQYKIPSYSWSFNWTCENENYWWKYIKIFNDNLESPDWNIYLDWIRIKSFPRNTFKRSQSYYYNKIASYVEHKSPTVNELQIQTDNMSTHSLPIDKERYIDFVSAKWVYEKIIYPNLFSIDLTDSTDYSISYVEQKLVDYINQKSQEINNIINSNNPSWLTWVDLEIYNLLKNGDYPNANIDLLNYLKNKANTTLNISWNSKSISYFDTLVFALYWSNLKSISAKYWFIFDNYLIDQFWEQDNNILLPANKKLYEIAYLWAKWNAQNMYIKMDPNEEKDNPYSDIFSKNINISSLLFSSNITDSSWVISDEENIFNCAPADWVPIWEWFPAIICRLQDMLPPTISIWESQCWENLFSDSNEQLDINDDIWEIEDEDIYECNWDINKNWINDCIENNLKNGSLYLSSDSDKYYYNSIAELTASIYDLEWNIVTIDNISDINFEIVKIEIPKDKTKELNYWNIEIVYDKNDINNNDTSVISQYTSAEDLTIRSQFWSAIYKIWLKSKISNIYVRAYIEVNNSEWNQTIFLDSWNFKVQVRWEKMFSNTYKLINSINWIKVEAWKNSIKVSDKTNLYLVDWYNKTIDSLSNNISSDSNSEEKLVLFLENISSDSTNTALNFPLNVSIFNDWKKVIEDISVLESQLSYFKPLVSLKKSWNYELEIVDSNWFKTKKSIQLLPDIVSKVDINLWTSTMESWWSISTNFISLYDKYDNPAIWTNYNIKFKISWDTVSFLWNSNKEYKTSTYEWYKVFRLESKLIEWVSNIDIEISSEYLENSIDISKNVNVNNDINLSIESISWDIKVWWWNYKYKVSIIDSLWNILTDFNSRVYLVADSIYLQPINSYFEIKNWLWEIEFNTKTVAWKDVPIEFQVEWLKKIEQRTVTILPWDPMKTDLIMSQNEIEASPDSYSTLNVELRDRYNNLVFNNNSILTSIEILEDYQSIISLDKTSATVENGVVTYKIYWKDIPWVAYFKVSTSPSLDQNYYTVWSWDKEIVVTWVWENAWKIETFYFWNKDKLEWKKYNSIYTTLLWANYWDIYEKDYLAWSLLFERDNRSLAVTSQLTNPYVKNNIIELKSNWWIESLYSKNDLSQDINTSVVFSNNKLELQFYNESLNTYIWKINYDFDDDNKIIVCDDLSIQSCIDESETSISLLSKSDNYSVYKENNKLIFRNIDGNNLIEISKDWTIERKWPVEFEYNDNVSSDYLLINIKTWWQIIWELAYNFIDSNISISRSKDLFDSKINNTSNSIHILFETYLYWIINNWNTDSESKIIYYNDPFWSDNVLNNFSNNNYYWLENFYNKQWIWWNNWNKYLLSFASWKSVWESVKDYMSFWIINLWDPVINLKKIDVKLPNSNTKRNFDSTIWELLSIDDDIKSYEIFDYNSDWRKDILLIKNDGYLKLLENTNTSEQFLDIWNLVYITDLWSTDNVKTWDFTGDWYEDIFFISKSWEPYLLNNNIKDFTRISLVENFDLNWRIIRVEEFDMDNDWKTDIVTLDDFWELNIFYWWWTKESPLFTKKTLTSDLWISLNSEVRNDWSIVYFDWLYQPLDTSSDIWEQILSQMYVKYPYSYEFENISEETLLSWESAPDDRWNIYMIKSEYSDLKWLKVEKKFIDMNWNYISSWDTVNVEVTLTNVWTSNLEWLVYAENVPEFFDLNKNSFESSIDFDIYDWISWYHYMIDNFDIQIWWQVKFTYEAKVKPLKYSYLRVWLFEEGEVWDDLYWDIIISNDNQNCSDALDIYRSLSTRSYQKWIKEPICDESKIILPEEIQKNTIDNNWNWIPDYIDELSNINDTTALQEYSEEKLDEMNIDSDNDWITDDQDYFNMEGSSITIDFWWMWDEIEWALDNIENILNWLSCWFWNESCFAFPLNWAPLAPWSDPTFMWMPIWDWLKVEEWLPIFSTLTWMFVGTACIPSVWPLSPLNVWCLWTWAWWRLWTMNPTNTLRIFVTPTLTWAVWVAICFWWPASVVWRTLPPGISPLIPGWNCVVVAKGLFWCNDDWSDWDPSSIWIPDYSIDWDFWVINWNCKYEENTQIKLDHNEISQVLEEIEDWTYEFEEEEDSNSPFGDLFSETPPDSLFNSSESDFSVELDLESLVGWDFDDVIKIEMKRISPFPDFIMDWVTRQIEEIANKLTDFPTLFIILPDFSWVLDWNWWDNDNKSILDSITSNNDSIDKDSPFSYARKVNSWIKEAYEFLSSVPLVNVEQETVNINIPWITSSEIDKTINSRKNTIKQREIEARETINIGEDNIDYSSLINSINKNIEILESYRDIPEKINELINIKEKYLEQILCNIESISSLLWWWIWFNGERFKAWVELYMLIKAILKSWQLLVDIFIDYEASCHQCKNERNDTLYWQFKLIDMIMPKIPVIEFPKWPDIILDLHNIRAWLNIYLPEFDIQPRPILLPSLPDLKLPNLNVKINLEIPTLPEFEIPELPDLPWLPTVELPNLPPPPKLPELLWSIEVFLDILKLVTKAMCILKMSPLHPEWRAWDQIAFLTERTWYLPFDFIDLSLPQFSFPFVDAIRVTTYVNLEFDVDFIVEMAKQIAMPINSFTSDFTNIFNVDLWDLDFSDTVQDIEVGSNIDFNSEYIKDLSFSQKFIYSFIYEISKKTENLKLFIENKENKVVSNKEFKNLINESMLSNSIIKDPKLNPLREIWNQVNNITYSKENKLIEELQKNNTEKFDTIKDIINTEILKNKELRKNINNSLKSNINKVWLNESNIELYNKNLNKYNDKFIDNLNKLSDWEVWIIEKELKDYYWNILSSINQSIDQYYELQNSNLLANSSQILDPNDWLNACQAQANSDYRYNYEWIYILEWDTSYRLFDYLDELKWDEEIDIIDLDNDSDEDILYFVNWELFKKTNLKNKSNNNYLSTNPLVLKSNNNKFYNWEIFYESVNNFSESVNSNWSISIWFSSPKNSNINNFRVWFYKYIDKYLWGNNNSYIPENIKKDLIDAVTSIDNSTIIKEDELYIERKNLVYMYAAWESLDWVKLKMKNFKNIRQDLESDYIVNITKWKKIYSWWNSVKLKYYDLYDKNFEQEKTIIIWDNSNIEFNKSINIVWIQWDAYIELQGYIEVEWQEIRNYFNKPLLPWTKIIYDWVDSNNWNPKYIDLRFYDETELWLDFSKISSRELKDLWYKSDSYYISIDKANDYYYAKINTFKNNIISTSSNQILLAPQKETDIYSPELYLEDIKIPVYQKQIFDLTPYIYEDSWIWNIKEVIVDMDLTQDTNWDWDKTNDNYNEFVNVLYWSDYLKLELWEFDSLFDKQIWINLIDNNNNIWYNEVKLQVYSPIPNIENFSDWTVYWSINEELTDEPINLYRYRWGVITSLLNSDWELKSNTIDWDYSFNFEDNSLEWLVLTKLWEEKLFVDESSWKITLQDRSLSINVFESNNQNNDYILPKIIVRDTTWQEIYYQYVKMESVDSVELVQSFEWIEQKWIYFKLNDILNYSYYSLPENIEYNPWALSVYKNWDENKTELFVIFNDWKINIYDNDYEIKYITDDENWYFKIINKNNDREVWRILFISDWNYIMK